MSNNANNCSCQTHRAVSIHFQFSQSFPMRLFTYICIVFASLTHNSSQCDNIHHNPSTKTFNYNINGLTPLPYHPPTSLLISLTIPTLCYDVILATSYAAMPSGRQLFVVIGRRNGLSHVISVPSVPPQHHNTNNHSSHDITRSDCADL